MMRTGLRKCLSQCSTPTNFPRYPAGNSARFLCFHFHTYSYWTKCTL